MVLSCLLRTKDSDEESLVVDNKNKLDNIYNCTDSHSYVIIITIGFTIRQIISNYYLRKLVFRKFLNAEVKAENFREYLRHGILHDRVEALKKIRTKIPHVEINLDSKYFEDVLKKHIRTNDDDIDTHKINEDEGHGDDNKINGDYSYNIIVIEFK